MPRKKPASTLSDDDMASISDDEALRHQFLGDISDYDISESDVSSSDASVGDPDLSLSSDSENSAYDSDFFKNDEDREELMSLPEFKREAILFERREKVQKKIDREKARARYRESQQAGSRTKRAKKERISALDDIRERRNKKSTTKQSERMVLADDEYDEQDHYDGYEPTPSYAKLSIKKREVKQEKGVDEPELPVTHTPIEYKTVKALQCRRRLLERIFNEPWFEEYVVGTYVRVTLVGQRDRTTNEPVYRMAEIVGVRDEGSKYQFGVQNIPTTKRLDLKLGSAVQPFKMMLVSSKSITEREFKFWKGMAERDSVPIPSNEELLKRKTAAEQYRRQYKYSHEDVERMVEQRMEATGNIRNYAAERIRIQLAYEHALEEEDEKEAERLKYKLDALEDAHNQQQERKAMSQASKESKPRSKVDVKVKRVIPLRKRRRSSGGNTLDAFKRVRRGDRAARALKEKQEQTVTKSKEKDIVRIDELDEATLDSIRSRFPFAETTSPEFLFLASIHSSIPSQSHAMDLADVASTIRPLGLDVTYPAGLALPYSSHDGHVYSVQEYKEMAEAE